MTLACCATVTDDFRADKVDGATFSHQDHVRVAYDLLRSHDFIAAASLYAKGIKSLTTRAGVPEKLNLTITYAFLSVSAERMAAGGGDSFEGFAEDNPDLMSKDVLLGWYEADRLHSDTARQIFLLPRRH